LPVAPLALGAAHGALADRWSAHGLPPQVSLNKTV
jgi:hypothetical protein